MFRLKFIQKLRVNVLLAITFVSVSVLNLYVLSWLMVFGLLFVKMRERTGASPSFVIALCSMWVSQVMSFLFSDITRSDLRLSVILLNAPLLYLLNTKFLSLKKAVLELRDLRILAVLIAPVSWILLQLIASQNHLNSTLSWALSGDARNNAIFIWGLKSGSVDVTPVTLVSGGFTGISASTLFEAQKGYSGFSQQALSSVAYDIRNFWILLLFTISILIGLLTFRLVSERSQFLSFSVFFAATGAVYSWSFLGRALEGGFLNSFVALTLILCGLVLWLEKNTSTLGNKYFMIGQSLVLILISITWAPLAVIPLGLLICSLASLTWNLLKRLPYLYMATVLTLFIVFVFTSLWKLYTSDLKLLVGQVFRTEGGFYPFGHSTLLALVLVVMLLALISHLNTRAILEVFASLAGVMIMLRILLWSRRDAAQIWGYYPLKFSWIVSMALFILAIALFASLIARSNRRFLLRLCAYGIAFGFAAYGLKADAQNLQGSSSPVWRVLSGWSAPNGEIVEELLYSEEFGQKNSFFYKFADRESDRLGNFWAALLATNVSQAIHWAYLYDSTSPASFCEITKEEPEVLVMSVDKSVTNELIQSCRNTNYSIVFR